mgnify:CR=1 FL=1|jgi:uncharacterized protein (TIGR00369 family)|tara:strand:+ start:1365 stop:1784 length:420 start_codon:yes stop_codon:yes gene_type:complete
MSDELSGLTELSGICGTLGIQLGEFGNGKCTVMATVNAEHLNAGGVAHGGLAATMLDTALGAALVSTLLKQEWCATAQLDISFLNAAIVGMNLIASGEIIRRGQNLAHLSGELVDESGKLIATAKGTWAVWDTKPSSLK